MIDKLKVEYIPIDQLKEYERNAKEHPEEHIKQIAASITEFGFNDPIGIDSDNTIIEGHGRLFAARKLKLKEVPIIRIGHLTDDQKKAYIIAHNRLTIQTGFDLNVLFNELESLDGDLQGLTGFTDEEISDMMDAQNNLERETRLIEVELHEPISKIGDIWVLDDKHKIICGDSTDDKTYKRLFNDGEMIDMVLTDPPYNVNYEGNVKNKRDKILNDNIEDFSLFISNFYKNMNNYMKEGSPFYIFYSDKVSDEFIGSIRMIDDLKLSQVLIWGKTSMVLSRSDYHWRHEPILYGWKTGASHYFTFDRTQTTVLDDYNEEDFKKMSKKDLINLIHIYKDNQPIEEDLFYYDKPSSPELHPTMKPVNILKKLMRNSSLVNDLIFDGFLGSGSTLIAAEELKRKCFGIELDEIYVDTSIVRYIKYKNDNNEEYKIHLIRDNEIIPLEDTGLLEIMEEI